MKLIKLRNHLTVVLNDGSTVTSSNCTFDLYDKILKAQKSEDPDTEVRRILTPEYFNQLEKVEEYKEIVDNIHNSKLLTFKGESIYLDSISELSLPEELAKAIYKAEKEGNEELIQTYKNFWTLASLNPDSRARKNLFWFLKRYGMTISKSGLFVAYRNVFLKDQNSEISVDKAKAISKLYIKVKLKWKKSPKNFTIVYNEDQDEYAVVHNDTKLSDEWIEIGNLQEMYNMLGEESVAPVYTDGYSHTFTIKIGQPVTMPRSECDSNQNVTCSRGLHVAGRDWLKNNYFGNDSLIVLVNPANVVAVPPEDSYGKMRTCAYYPVALVERDENGDIINDNIPDGFEDDFINMITYEGNINNKDLGNYKLEIPAIPEINSSVILSRLQDIKNTLNSRVVK